MFEPREEHVALKEENQVVEKRPGFARFRRMAGALMAVLCMVAPMGVFAAEGGGGDTSLTSGVSTMVTLVGQIVALITGNTILMAFLGAALLGTAIGIFVRLFRSVRH